MSYPKSPMYMAAAHPQQASHLPGIYAVTGYGLFESFQVVAPEFAGRARIELLHDAFESVVDPLEQAAAQGRCDIVVASGSNGAFLRTRLSLPVVLVQVGGYDLMAALTNARQMSDRIAVVLHSKVPAELRRFARVFGMSVDFRAYETLEDVKQCIHDLASDGVQVVVGAGMVTDYAERAGLAGVLLYSPDSVRAAMDTALAIALAQYEERSRRDRLDLVLRHLNDGVVAVDMQGRVTTMNPAAARIVGTSAGQAQGRPLTDAAPGLSPESILARGVPELGRIDDVRGQSLVVDCVALYEAGTQTGALLTLHPSQSLEHAVGRLRAHSHRRSRSARYTLNRLVAVSASMRELVHRCEVLARNSDASVLIQGESGSGKEVVAQGIHRASRRHARPFVAINCGAFPEQLLESELFGYEEGAFTGARRQGKAGLFEAADGGTLLLDEVGEMPLPLQTRLLRVLQEKEITRVGGIDAIPIDVRIIAATHRDLAALASEGKFRHDLFYRLHILQIRVPSLRERPEDIEALAADLLPAALKRVGAGELAADALRAALPLLIAHDWPGNVRELENVIERIAVECLLAGRVPPDAVLRGVFGLLDSAAWKKDDRPSGGRQRLHAVQRAAEIDHIRETLRVHGGNQAAAAQALGISRTTLWRKIRSA
jgi:propionate catabolism operon transcriptional regulator